MANQEMHPFVAEVLSRPGGELVLQCYQCGTCSGSCPVIEDMDYGPRRIMHMIQAGMEAEVLSSHDMWYCVSCYSCMNRCPRDIPITDTMALLRAMAVEKGYQEDKEAQFGQAFAATVRQHGRMFEPELMIRYYLRTLDIWGLLGMVPLGVQMLFKGKLPFWPERVAHPQDLEKICAVEEQPDAPPPAKQRWLPWLAGAVTMVVGAGLSGVLWGWQAARRKED